MSLPIPQIVDLLCRRFPDLQGIYLYGSAVSNEMTSASDIDLAVLSQREIPEMERFETAQQIALVTKREVDLADLRRAPTVFQFQVISTGKHLYVRDAAGCEKFSSHRAKGLHGDRASTNRPAHPSIPPWEKGHFGMRKARVLEG